MGSLFTSEYVSFDRLQLLNIKIGQSFTSDFLSCHIPQKGIKHQITVDAYALLKKSFATPAE